MAGPLIPGSRMNPLSPQDPLTQLNTFKSYVAIIADSTNNIAEKKSKAVQELCENFELIVSNPHYPQFIGEALKVFIKVLNESETVFISEYTNQQLRKSLLELLQRVPANDHLKPYVQPVLSLMYKLLEIDCEENALVCLRVIIELNKSFKPPYSSDITNFLKFVKDIYTALPRHLDKLFEHRSQMKVNNITDLDINAACEDLLCTITVVTEKKNAENQNINYNLMPRATASLKVLAELPIIVVLMYQLYKQQVHNEVAEFIPLIMNTINMHPSPEQRASPQFNREIFVDFIAAQIKTLSFLAYIIRIYQDAITAHSAKMVQGMLDLLTLCPPEVAHLRKELLIASRHILATDLRTKFVPHIEKLFDEDVLFGSGWTTHESLRPLAFSTLADLVHHIRQNLTMSDLQKAVNLFSKNVHDDTLPCSIQNMSCKLLLNLVECIRSKSETENSTSNVAGRPIRGREIFLRMLEVFVLKFQVVAEVQLPSLLAKCRQSEAAATASLSTSSPLPNLSSSFSSSSSASKLKTPQHQQQQQQQQQQSNNANTCTTPESPLLSTPQQSSSSLSSAALSLSSTKKQLFVDSTDSMKALLSSTTTATSASSSAAGPAAASSSGGGGGGGGSVGYAGSNLGLGLDGGIGGKDDGKTSRYPSTPTYSVTDCKGLVKTLVSGVKTITWGLTSCKAVMDPVMFQNKQFLPREIHVYIRLVKFALSALDIYTINTTSQGLIQIRSPSVQTVRTKEEKEVLEHFAGVFIMMSQLTFKEIFSTVIEFMVNRIHANYALQIIANTFLASPTTSATFATILVEYLLLHMDEMGSSVEQSSLYLKLFKLVFGSVSLLANENEQMLKPHLHTIVNRSMELARTAKEPFNYFLLLRALFRSIGGGSHDLLYQEFLPLLPNLLQGLNSLQSGLHKQHMKDLFVELCLTVPVRLSSLLPYLPMLMDPLVSALNGSQTLVSQGLRTLELCVDNLQPDFLFSHIEPVKAELMQALWRCLNNAPDPTAAVAYRVLGKFGGSNRKMLHAPQKLTIKDYNTVGPCVAITFLEGRSPINLPVDTAIETALNLLKTSSSSGASSSSSSSGSSLPPSIELYYQQHAWNFVRTYLISTLVSSGGKVGHDGGSGAGGGGGGGGDATSDSSFVSFAGGPGSASTFEDIYHYFSRYDLTAYTPQPSSTSLYICPDVHARRTHIKALCAMFVASSVKDLTDVNDFIISMVTHYALVAISQQIGPSSLNQDDLDSMMTLDPQTMIDAIITIIGGEERDLANISLLALATILKVAVMLLGGKDKACKLPLFEYLSEKIVYLCYERAWYNKIGGCLLIKFMYENASLEFLMSRQLSYLKAFIFVITDLTGEVSNGTLTVARTVMEEMCVKCSKVASSLKQQQQQQQHPQQQPQQQQQQQKQQQQQQQLTEQQKVEFFTVSCSDCVKELCRHITSPNQLVREHVMHVLQSLAAATNQSLNCLMEPFKEVITDVVPPKKHLLRYQPPQAQIGIMEGNAFCMCMEPHLVTLDMNVVEHQLFFKELCHLCDDEDSALHRMNCYKNVTDFVPLRISAIKVLSACHHVSDKQNNIFSILYKALNSTNVQLQDVALVCMKRFVSGCQVEISMVHTTMRPLLQHLSDFSNLNLHRIKVLSSLTQIFPNTFNEKLCEQMLTHLKKWFEFSSTPQKLCQIKATGQVLPVEQKICAAIIEMFHLIPAASQKMIDLLVMLVVKGEKDLFVASNSPFRPPTLKFLLRHPEATVDFFFSEGKLQDTSFNALFRWLLEQDKGQSFRDNLMSNPQKLLNLTVPPYKYPEQQFFAVTCIRILVERDDRWLAGQSRVVAKLLTLWVDRDFHDRHQNVGSVDYPLWQEPSILLEILLSFFKHHPNELELLFHMLKCFTGRYMPQFTFFKEFLEETVSKTYSTEWKRNAFFKFVEIFHLKDWSQEVKSKILQHILIPCFAESFDRDEGEQLIGGPPAPDQESDDNVISIFINKVIDPDNPFGTSDAVRILLLQLSCLFVDKASKYIHDVANKKQGSKLRRLMTFAWPCLLTSTCVDPATKYHGHLLLSHIIAKFAIHKRIVLQVFHSLLKAHAVEARAIVRQALDVLTPVMPGRMEDENNMLAHWTKKIISEDGHTVAQLIHILQLIVRHHKVYYLVRSHLIQNVASSIQRLGLTPTATAEHRKLAVDLAEVILNWEVQRLAEEGDESLKTASGGPEASKPIDKAHCDTAVNFLLRIACQMTETPGSPSDQLSRRCILLLKKALSPQVWSNIDLKLNWFDKILMSVEGQQPNINHICTSLELLTFLTGILKKETILSSFKSLQRGVAACMTSTNIRIIRVVHTLLSNLMSIFPTEPAASTVASKFEELECLYACVSKLIYEGLANYEKVSGGTHAQLFGTLMILKAACQYNPSYIDRLITSFMRVLQRLVREHLSSTTQSSPTSGTAPASSAAGSSTSAAASSSAAAAAASVAASAAAASPESTVSLCELLIISLDLVKNRTGVMNPEMRKGFLGNILVGLIEKSPDVKVIKAILKILDEWMKNKSPASVNQIPCLREKAFLLMKLMNFVEKRFPDDLEINAQFLELVHYLYSDETLKTTDLASKLEPAFLAGLRCVQPHIRKMFMTTFEASMRRRLFDRLHYIVTTQNWEAMGGHFWIKQCLELLFLVTNLNIDVNVSSANSFLAPISTSSLSSSSSSLMAATFPAATFSTAAPAAASASAVPMEVEGGDQSMEAGASREDSEQQQQQQTSTSSPTSCPSALSGDPNQQDCVTMQVSAMERMTLDVRKAAINMLTSRSVKFIQECQQVTDKTQVFIESLIQMCHNSTTLAYDTWIQFFPRVWATLNDKFQNFLKNELTPFIASGNHLVQRDSHPSAIKAFVEAMSYCGSPSLYIRPSILKYLAKSHNIWHRCLLCLEGQVYQGGLLGSQLFSKLNTQGLLPNATAAQSSATSKQMDALEAMVDLYGRLKEEDMVAGVWMKRCKYQATYTAIALEQHGLFFHAQEEYEKVMSQGQSDSIHTAIPNSLVAEFKLWENQWFRCSKEMNHWDLILEYSKNPDHLNPALMLESSWRQSQWQATKSALSLVEDGCPREDLWRINLYKGYLAVCHPEDQNLSSVEKLVETSSGLAIKEWRRLPHIVSQIHVEYLQAAQLIIELQEAASLAASMQPSSMGREQSNHDIKAIIKTWRNRMPSITDDLSHWGHIFQWRQEHFQTITNIYEQLGTNDVSQQNASMLGVHHTAVGMVEFGKIARKHSLPSVCLDSLSKIHSIASVPVVDCYQKIRQQVKCYLLMSGNMGKSELQEGLEVIESTTLKYFTKEMISEFYALKGLFLVQMAKSEEANKAFSAAVQLHDAQVKAWFLWGEYLEALFIRERTMQLAVSTIVCYLQACRNQNEIKSRKYIAKILWLLSYDDENNQLTEQLEKHSGSIPTAFWLVWIPQLLSCLIRSETRYVINLISKVGSVYPQAVYFPTRTLYLTLKVEQREIYNRSSSSATGTTTTSTTTATASATASATTTSSTAAAASSTSTTTAPLSITPVTAMSSTSLLSPPPADMSHGNLAGLLNSPEHVGPMKATNSMWKCSRVMHMQRDTQPTVLSLLESIIDQMVWFRENCYEEVLRQLKQALSKCYTVAFESRGTVTDAQVTTNTLNFIKKIVSTFGVGVETSAAATAAATTATLSPGTSTSVGAPWSQQQQAMSSSLMSMFGNAGSESLARRCLTAAQDPIFQRMKAQFIVDFDFSAHGSTRLQNVMNKLKKWVRIMETRISSLPKTFLIEEKCRVLSYFNMSMLEIELPGEFLVPQQNGYYMKIERFLPQVDIVHKLNSAARRLYIRGQNGKIYPYLVVNNTCMNESRREERVYQLFRMMNVFLSKQKETARRLIHYSVPRVVALNPHLRLIEDNPQSISLLDIYKENCTKQAVDPDQPITRYYERLAAIQLRGSQPSHQVLCDLLRDVQANMVPRSVLKEWAIRNYAHATDYWTFRKNVTTHLGLLGLSEFVLHLTRLDPDMIHLHRDSGFVHAAYFKFDIDDETGDLNANRPVPFRLTPNLTEFMTQLNIIGPLLAAMIATARCLVQPQYKLQSFLCAILRDEYMAWYKKKQEELNPGVQPPEIPGELLVQVVSKAVQAITIRLQNLAAFEGADSKVTTLVVAANSLDNLCRMDPAWHPWL